ncbi:hypothetical protein ISN45_Aa05g011840 [Arabidopsis thaliana x Arabidopsis arenosa]|uniref:Uncharacterized protein n=1 Tax=Arabidopsis thaliana x Arabidopsis arenosa TaxID=1240361 RepID=A0A8T1ZN50_9BRAS|nr:hypothetical protein ISN45_Aa05g011840 [Arabidopsis thaliana x Arabidopsis arenosa]
MFSYMNSKWKLMLEEQERGIAWSPTSYHGPNEASSSNEYQPDVYYAQDNQHGNEYQPDVYYAQDNQHGNEYQPDVYYAQDNQHGYEYQPDVYYAQENQCGYGEEYQSCNMEYDYTCYQGPYESSTSREYQHDEHLYLLLESEVLMNYLGLGFGSRVEVLDSMCSHTPCYKIDIPLHIHIGSLERSTHPVDTHIHVGCLEHSTHPVDTHFHVGCLEHSTHPVDTHFHVGCLEHSIHPVDTHLRMMLH